jgi:hypothetical protein
MAIVQNVNVRDNRQQPPHQPQRQVREEDQFQHAFIAMLNVMRRIHDMTGDPSIKEIIDKAERALARR